MRLGNETMILLVSELPQNPIFITILSNNHHLKTIKRFSVQQVRLALNILFDLFSFA